MYSPVKAWRDLLGLSQSKLAQEAGMSEQTIIRYEQLLYSDLSPRLISIFKALGEEETYYERLYHRSQVLTRSETDWFRATVPHPVDAFDLETHPFIMWRESLGFSKRMEFCRAACVSPPQLLSLETGGQGTMPKQFKDALSPFIDLKPLEECIKQYTALVKDAKAHAVN